MNQCHDRLLALLDLDGARLFALLTRLTLRQDIAGDLMQELFIRLSQNLAWQTAQNPSAYVRRAAINLAFEWRRSRRDSSNETPVDQAFVADAAALPIERLIDAEQLQQVLSALDELTELARECFVLRYIQRESHEIIAQKLGKTAHQIRGMCHAAIQQIRARVMPGSDEVRTRHAAGKTNV